ncbi:hypothetical protein [Variovorax sp. OV329]|uniref:hypothetical protein n=1 Tax=Variovorax sp. OV329 TaxID=1882825 RepID=UPI0008E524A8|nr:hypothetical protein [Variovorax sp. OV329]SFN24149.1 hypothetical protein SAMN05444747_11922 [Variovorax sp. OV329]
MRFLNKFRAAEAIALAAELIDRNLQLLAGANPIAVGSKGKGAALVMDLWRTIPKVADGPEKPAPVLLAAGALAKAIRESELDGDGQKCDVLHGTLQLLWISDLGRSLDARRLSGIDKRLFDSALSVLRLSWLSKLEMRPD